MATTNLLSYALLILPLLALFSSQGNYIDKAVGRVRIDTTQLVRWANSKALNNANCQVNHAANACEDVRIHSKSGTAFLACGNPVERTNWYPPAGVRGASKRSEASFREQLFKYDLKSKRTTKLKIVGLEGDFVTHGLDIYSFPEDPSKVMLVKN